MKVRIYPNHPNFENLLKLYPPVLANKLLPEWYKNMPLQNKNISTAKKCPAIQDVLSEGFIIPLWGNLYFETKKLDDNSTEQSWFIQNANIYKDLEYWIQQHKQEQIEGMKIKQLVNGSILKIKYPFRIVPPEGYGLMYHDPFYQFRNDIRCLTGLVKSDQWGFITFPFEILKDNFEIKAGTPLVHVYLYKLNNVKLELDVGPGTETEYKNAALIYEQDILENTNYKTRKKPYIEY